MPPSAARSVSAAVAWAAARLSEAGIAQARAEAEMLVAAASGLPRESLILHPEALLSPDALAALDLSSGRRSRREPLAYVLGEVEFYSLRLSVDPAAIIPRPETEVLVEAALTRGRALGAEVAVDVGTGCGAIAIALARHMPRLRVIATDISHSALLLARTNCRTHGVPDRVAPVCADLLTALRRPVHLIVANLPYIRRDEFPGLQPEVRDFEPRIGLEGGEDGLAVIRRLSAQLFDHLCPGGAALLEVGAGQASQVKNLLARGGLSQLEVIADYGGIERVVVGWRKG